MNTETYTPSAEAVTRSAGYTIRRTCPVGTELVAVTPFFHYRSYPAGTRGTVRDYTNAGFRGIEVSLTLADGTYVHGVNAGHFVAAR